jgi:hypothetical protein
MEWQRVLFLEYLQFERSQTDSQILEVGDFKERVLEGCNEGRTNSF